MEFTDLVRRRRSIRKFRKELPAREVLQRIVEAALEAPSAKNTRSTRLMVVTDKPLVEHMADMRDFGSAFLAGAPAAVVVMGDRQASDLWVDNAAITASYLQLAAVDAGLGSCWIHVNGRLHASGRPEEGTAEEYLRTFLPVPPQCGVLCVIALGYSDYEPKPLPADEKQRVQWIDGSID